MKTAQYSEHQQQKQQLVWHLSSKRVGERMNEQPTDRINEWMHESNLMLRIKYIFHEIFTYIAPLYIDIDIFLHLSSLSCHHDLERKAQLVFRAIVVTADNDKWHTTTALNTKHTKYKACTRFVYTTIP